MTDANDDVLPAPDAASEVREAGELSIEDEYPSHPKPTLSLRNGILLVSLLAIVLFGLLVPLPFRGPVADPLADLAHAPLFCALALGALGLLAVCFPRRVPSRTGHLEREQLRPDHTQDQEMGGWAHCIGRSSVVFVLLALFGVATEYLQKTVGRNASWGDVQANMVGSVAGILLFWALEWRRKGRRDWRTGAPVFISIGLLVWISIRPAMLIWNLLSGS